MDNTKKYHLNRNNGKIAECTALTRECPNGGPHFTNVQDAQLHADRFNFFFQDYVRMQKELNSALSVYGETLPIRFNEGTQEALIEYGFEYEDIKNIPFGKKVILFTNLGEHFSKYYIDIERTIRLFVKYDWEESVLRNEKYDTKKKIFDETIAPEFPEEQNIYGLYNKKDEIQYKEQLGKYVGGQLNTNKELRNRVLDVWTKCGGLTIAKDKTGKEIYFETLA